MYGVHSGAWCIFFYFIFYDMNMTRMINSEAYDNHNDGDWFKFMRFFLFNFKRNNKNRNIAIKLEKKNKIPNSQ